MSYLKINVSHFPRRAVHKMKPEVEFEIFPTIESKLILVFLDQK